MNSSPPLFPFASMGTASPPSTSETDTGLCDATAGAGTAFSQNHKKTSQSRYHVHGCIRSPTLTLTP